MKFSFSRWPLRILWLALYLSHAFYFRTEATAYEIYENNMPTKYSGFTVANLFAKRVKGNFSLLLELHVRFPPSSNFTVCKLPHFPFFPLIYFLLGHCYYFLCFSSPARVAFSENQKKKNFLRNRPSCCPPAPGHTRLCLQVAWLDDWKPQSRRESTWSRESHFQVVAWTKKIVKGLGELF